MTTSPKLFISYSWSSTDHEAWVIRLAEELASQGIHVILDKWDLQPGYDANAFMESMVSDPDVTKVLLICDEKYVVKSNRRDGGAGTEAQIITPELYAKKAQDKFVAVVRERDDEGKPYLPAYYGGRIYIDFSNPNIYSTEFDRLVRWAWDQPLYVRPAVGSQPSFIVNPQTEKISISVEFRRAIEGIKSNATNAPALASEYFAILSDGLEVFRLAPPNSGKLDFDDEVIQSINDFTALRNQTIELLVVTARYQPSEEMARVIHRFFETLAPYLERPKNVNSWRDTDFDNFRFIVHELFIYTIGILLKYERFDLISTLLNDQYYWDNSTGRGEKMYPFDLFNAHVKSFQVRNQRLNLRRLSLHADLLHERSDRLPVEFSHIMAADFVLFLRSVNLGGYGRWWPHTLLYAGRFAGAFEPFARAKSLRYFDRIKGMIGVHDKKELGTLIEQNDGRNVPRWEFESFSISSLSGFDTLATMP